MSPFVCCCSCSHDYEEGGGHKGPITNEIIDENSKHLGTCNLQSLKRCHFRVLGFACDLKDFGMKIQTSPNRREEELIYTEKQRRFMEVG